MDSSQIRQNYLDFFKKQSHAIIPPAPLVPKDDPTTLFTGSGMQQLVPYLKGEPHPMGKRLTDSQPCFRAEDIKEVGDNRHTTFFEMLGNWSLGDYLKKEQLFWFFEFLTKKIGLDAARLYVTVFEGSKEVPRDEESIKIWQKLFKTKEQAQDAKKGFDPKIKIYTYEAAKNWWSRAGTPDKMPAGEIGGPDSEVFFDFDPDGKLKLHEKSLFKNKSCHVNCDCGRFLEIGNSVFMEYEKQKDGSFKPLPAQNVDFGGGLERITAASQNTPDIFKTDFFSKAIKVLESIKKSGEDYNKNPKPYRIIVDHLRGAIFMAAEGIEPENKGRGYILRRLLRRSMIYARKLGLTGDQWLSNALPNIATSYLEVYPEINKKIPKISERLTGEVDKFRKTIDKGLREIERLLVKKENITGENAFFLYETYGFPLELTQELLLKRGLYIDNANFVKAFIEHREKHAQESRTASAGMFKGGLADKSEEVTKLHTATHLLHESLRRVLDTHVQQVGSNITVERLRFDFTHPNKLTAEQIKKVEDLVNEQIKKNLKVTKKVMTLNQAKENGALAFFGERYGEKVSVYVIADPSAGSGHAFSMEVCGGPHVDFTGRLGRFTIKKEESCGAGKRRIYAMLK